jgi:hypothetical protein
MQIILISVISYRIDHLFVKAAFWFQVIEFTEYLIIYNNPWFYIGGIGINVTIIRFFVLFCIIMKELLHGRMV